MVLEGDARDLRWAHVAAWRRSVSFSLNQPSSRCDQQADNDAIKVDISKDDVREFSRILLLLRGNSALRNLDFGEVEWDEEGIAHLCWILENCSLERLVFQKNKFEVHGLRELMSSLGRSKCVKELVWSRSGIRGSEGIELLANALVGNTSLEDLQIRQVSIGSKGAEELSKMIQVNSSLKMLKLYDLRIVTATPLISAVLESNRSLEMHAWSNGEGGNDSKMVECVPETGLLHVFNMDFSGARRVASSLGVNSTIRILDLNGIQLKPQWAKEFGRVLEQNLTLREAKLSRTGLTDQGVIYVAAGLFKNKSLEKLFLEGNSFSGVGVNHLLCPLSKFSLQQKQANTFLKTVTFGGGRTKVGRDGLKALLHMLKTNESLTFLGIYGDHSLSPESIAKIFKSLEGNATLKQLSLQGCKGVKGEPLLQAIIELLNVNSSIEDIDLARTPLHATGRAQAICQRLNRTESLEPIADNLDDMPMVPVRTCRVFLCGDEFAGKSTICSSISQSILIPNLAGFDQLRIFVNTINRAIEAPGIKIRTMRDAETKIMMWNLAGHHEMYSMHDVMFPGPGTASLFLIICSLVRKPSNTEPKSPSEIEEDLECWLEFILSNSRRAAQQCMLPMVTTVLTHCDRINQLPDFLQTTVSVVHKMRNKFCGLLDCHPTIFTVNARLTESVSELSHHIRKTSRAIIERVPQVYQDVIDMVELLSGWRQQNRNKPVMKWEEFAELCQNRIPSLRIHSRRANKDKVEIRRRTVAKNLHQIGELVYFDDLEFLILDHQWFHSKLLTRLTAIDARTKGSGENSGFISQPELEKILAQSLQIRFPGMGLNIMETFRANDLIQIMLKMELCYKQYPSDPYSPLLFPSNMEENKMREQRWPLNTPECKYVGRRLQSDDINYMFFRTGFFPRLQVELYNKIMGLTKHHGAFFSLEKCLLKININGIYVRIEVGRQQGYCIDLLACSTKSQTEMLRVLEQVMIPEIHRFCSGITFMECALRSECARILIPFKYRRTQFVPLHNLKQALLALPAEMMYDYQHSWDPVTDSRKTIILGHGFDFARDMLSDDGFKEVLSCRYTDIYNLAMELQVPEESRQDPPHDDDKIKISVEPTLSGLAKGVEAILQRLNIIQQEIRDIKQEIQGMRYYEQKLLMQLHHTMKFLVNFNVQLEERKVPNMFYFVRTEKLSRRLITSIISGMTALRLHMMCEYRQEMHVVEDQIGCEVMQIDNSTVKTLAPYMTKFMKLVTFALKIGAHLAAGMGEMIPDLSRQVAHLLQSPSTSLYAVLGAGAVASAAATRRRDGSTDIRSDIGSAQQWLLSFLKENGCSTGKDIAEKFGLWRVRYRNDGQIAWICRRHMLTRGHEIIELPG